MCVCDMFQTDVSTAHNTSASLLISGHTVIIGDHNKARMFALCCLTMLLVNPGMCSHKWAVNYLNKMKCALKGSTTILSGSFTYPADLSLTEIFWTVNPVREKETHDLSKEAEYKGRVKYIRSDDQTFFLKLCNATYKDEKMYCIRIVTDEESGKYLGYPGIELKVTELSVEVPQEVIEGNSAVLFCKTTCNFADSTKYSWYKNKIPLSESFSRGELLLRSVSSDDAGEYSCALREHEDLPSPAVTLNVRYPPKNSSASISSSGVIVEGDSVTLTCSSESNPPVHIYSWFKKEKFVGSGNIYRISDIRSDHSGEYKCKTRNNLGEKYSEAVTLNVMYAPRNVSASISSSGVIVEGDSVTLTCSSESNPPVHIYSWFKENQTSSVGSGQTFSITNINSRLSGWFYCVAQNEHGSQKSAAVSVIFADGRSKALHITAGIVTALFCICAVVLIRIVRRKTAVSGVSDRSKQGNISVTATDQIPAHPTASPSKQVNQNDLYAIIAHHRPSASNRDQTAGNDEEVQYASVHHYKNTKNNKEEAESHYGNVSNHYSAISSRSNAGLVEDSSVIYSSIKVT